ncbi:MULTISPECIES: hypothetical protein [unclassified Methanoregula]|uniref:hypothetical protein n=1 Tax=unclassified Methanoregula TaxID=2649730 RepID=UPI0009CCA746|nr:MULTISPECIES: hypothetical protein [unclassified Methanoregula]OPX64838.1 MAG: hypothetical protein A4E33_00576 [Methanoregula sp. PtaB.Bin085]OPY32890.1 MAG: hypothetical protein A4E34_02267 [Methanoregula sp. PtaU1.Bin006]
MGSPYLSSNESIVLSTNNVVVNSVPAEAILTNERLMLIDTRHAELRPQDIPFHAIETVTISEDSAGDPVVSLSLVTAPGVTVSIGITFPQQPRMKRFAERDEWANRIRELSIVTIRAGGSKPVEILPPWVPGPLPETGDGKTSAAAPGSDETESKFRNPPLMPRRPHEPEKPKNRMAITAVVAIIVIIALAAVVYVLVPSLFGNGGSPLQPATPAPTEAQTIAPTPVPTTEIPVTTLTPAVSSAPVSPAVLTPPDTGVYLRVTYDGKYNGTAGAAGRFRDIADSGTHLYQLSVRDMMVRATIQKQDAGGGKLTVDMFSDGKLVKSASTSAPKGIVDFNVDLRTL